MEKEAPIFTDLHPSEKSNRWLTMRVTDSLWNEVNTICLQHRIKKGEFVKLLMTKHLEHKNKNTALTKELLALMDLFRLQGVTFGILFAKTRYYSAEAASNMQEMLNREKFLNHINNRFNEIYDRTDRCLSNLDKLIEK